MSNKGNFITSLGNVCRWLGKKAEALGVEIYPGFCRNRSYLRCRRPSHGSSDRRTWVSTRMGSRRTASRGESNCAGNTRSFAEGARGSPQQDAHRALCAGGKTVTPRKFGLGLKELWAGPNPDKHHPGLIQHSFGWPLDNKTGGGVVPVPLRRKTWWRWALSCISTTTILG